MTVIIKTYLVSDLLISNKMRFVTVAIINLFPNIIPFLISALNYFKKHFSYEVSINYTVLLYPNKIPFEYLNINVRFYF